MTTSPIALTISARTEAPVPLPAALEQRLAGSPTKTPEDLAEELAKHSARTEKLRQAHLEAVKDRAVRENQRVEEAAARKRRLAAWQIEKVQRRLVAADQQVDALREANAAKREANKLRRDSMAQMVMDSRRRAVEARELAHAEALEAERQAQAKHATRIQLVHDKSARVVQHALDVVTARKEKDASTAAESAAKLNERLNAAESRRLAASPGSPSKNVLGRVRNEWKIEAQLKESAYKKAMDRAEANRSAILASAQEKLHSAHEAVAEKVAAVKDGDRKSAKGALYEKLQRADVARLSHLKSRGMGRYKGDTTSVIVVRVENKCPRTPPATLVQRLAVVSHGLLATAPSRHSGATMRRASARAALVLKLAQANARRADAAKRVGLRLAEKEAKFKGRMARAVVTRALFEGRRAHVLAQEHKRAVAVHQSRLASDEKRSKNAALFLSHEAAVSERRAAVLRRVAKHGVVAVRAGMAKSRREALRANELTRGCAHAERCQAAAAKKEMALSAVVDRARLSAMKKVSDS